MAGPLLQPGRPILDIGTGVGLPGLPLALAQPALPVVLVEPRARCIGLIHWVLDQLPPVNVRVIRSDAASLPDHRLPPCQVLTRAALDWPGLRECFYPGGHPMIRWSGPDVELPPRAPGWTGRRLTVTWEQSRQEFCWWGPDRLFHVKQSAWEDNDAVQFCE